MLLPADINSNKTKTRCFCFLKHFVFDPLVKINQTNFKMCTKAWCKKTFFSLGFLLFYYIMPSFLPCYLFHPKKCAKVTRWKICFNKILTLNYNLQQWL